VWSEGQWYEFHHSITSGQPYHEGHHIEVYPTPVYPDTEDKSTHSIDGQIKSAPAVIKASGPGSPHRERNSSRGTPIEHYAFGRNAMSPQTLAAMTETISQTIVPGSDGEPTISTQHENPQHIHNTFDIALG